MAIVGDADDPRTRALAVRLWSGRYLPNVVMAVGSGDGRPAVELLRDRVAIDGIPTAYVCERSVCSMPVTSPEALDAQLVG